MTSTIGGALWLVRLSYAIPLNTYGTKLGGAYTHSHVGVDVGAVVGDLNVRGDADIGSLYLLHPFIRSREFSVYGQAGFDYKDFTNDFESRKGRRRSKTGSGSSPSAVSSIPWTGGAAPTISR